MTSFETPQTPQEARQRLEHQYGRPSADAMSPYERVLRAIQRQTPDRVPFDYWAVPETQARLMDYLQARDEEELLRLLGGLPDCVAGPHRPLPPGAARRNFFGPLGQSPPQGEQRIQHL